jgi:hypothetical protein
VGRLSQISTSAQSAQNMIGENWQVLYEKAVLIMIAFFNYDGKGHSNLPVSILLHLHSNIIGHCRQINFEKFLAVNTIRSHVKI